MLKADLASEESELSHYLQTHSKGSYVMSLLEWPETQHRETVNGQQSSQRTFHMGRTENNQSNNIHNSFPQNRDNFPFGRFSPNDEIKTTVSG